MELTDIWRATNFVLSTLALGYLLIDFVARRRDLSTRRLYLTLSLAGLLAGVAIGSIYYILIDAGAHLHTAIFTASSIWCILGLWLSRNDPT